MKWFEKQGKNNDIIIATEVYIYRNLKDYCFPHKLDSYTKREISNSVISAMASFEDERKFYAFDMAKLSRKQKISFAERRIISPSFVVEEDGCAVILSDDEAVSISTCGREHIAIRVCMPGDEVNDAYSLANRIDDYLNTYFTYAFDEKFGYLFADPQMCGNGMSVTGIMFLPGLSKLSTLRSIGTSALKLGVSVRGIFGTENNQVGDIFAVSNNLGMGLSENQVIRNFNLFIHQLATSERNSSESFAGDISATDRITRSFEILKGAKLLSAAEMLDVLSWVRMGINMGLIECDSTTINSCIFALQPATLSVMGDKMLDVSLRDRLRADILREKFSNE